MFRCATVVALLTAASSALAQTDDSQEQRAYEGRMDSQVRSWIHEGNHAATDEERTFINQHWERAEKLWRIRSLAEAAHDTGSIARVDALMARADRILEDHMQRYREHAPVITVAPASVDTPQAPPPPENEVRPPPPSPNEVWMPGFWQWTGSHHVWASGRWSAPPQPGMTWDPPRWENRSGRYAFIDGRWHHAVQPAPTVVYEPPPTPEVDVQTAPPPPLVEVRPQQPPNTVWIPGYWQWSGNRHVWVGGRWSAQKPGMRWQPDHWERRGNQYHLTRGQWTR
jgi:YXWGXW repeat-containing protein